MVKELNGGLIYISYNYYQFTFPLDSCGESITRFHHHIYDIYNNIEYQI